MRFKKVIKKKVEPIKEIKKKEVPKEEIKIPTEPFVTTDKKLVEKLQKNFTIKNTSLDRNTGIRTFEFIETKEAIEKFLKEV